MKSKVQKGELIFTGCVAVYVLILTVLCFGYSAESRLFPFLVIVPTILFLVLRFLSILNPKLSGLLEPDASMIDLEKVQRFARTADKHELAGESSREIKVILWILGLVLLTYLLGMLPGIALFVFFFVKFYGKKKIIASVAYTAVSWIFVYILFVVILQARLYTGILGTVFLE
jgi:hypothetical protein